MTRWSILTATGFFAVFTLLIHWRHSKQRGGIPSVALILVVILDLWLFSNPMIQTTNFEPSLKKTSVVKFLSNDPDLFRVVTASDFLKPNEALLHGYQNIEGYDPLILKRYVAYINKSQKTPQFSEAVHIYYVTNLDNPLIRMLNLKYAIGPDGQVLKLQATLPRAFMAPTAITLPPETALDAMMGRDFDPTSQVLLAPEDKEIIFPEQGVAGFQGSCRISHYDHEAIRISTSANQAGYLVLSEVFYPGWETTVDGHRANTVQGNYLFRVIPLEKGNHEVECRFVSWPFRSGLAVSLLTLAGCLAFMLWESKRRDNTPKSESARGSASGKKDVHVSVRITRENSRN